MCLALAAPVRCVGVGADQQRDVQLLGWVSDGEDDLGESKKGVRGRKPQPQAAPAPLPVIWDHSKQRSRRWLGGESSCKHGHCLQPPCSSDSDQGWLPEAPGTPLCALQPGTSTKG